MSQYRCATCHWWQKTPSDEGYRGESNLVVLDENYERVEPQPFELRRCWHPKLRFFERPERDGAAVLDGSEYWGTLVTGPDFGCVNHETVPPLSVQRRNDSEETT